MSHPNRKWREFLPRFLFVFVFCVAMIAYAQSVVSIPVQVSDAADRPIPRVTLSAKGDSSTSPPTDKAGKTHLILPGSIAPGTQVPLVLIDSPDAKLRFLSPWEGHATIPLGEPVEVVLGTPGDPSMLNNQQVRQSIRGAIMAKAAAGPGGPEGPANSTRVQLALDKVSAELALKPGDVADSLQRFAKKDASARRESRQQASAKQQKSSPTQQTTSSQSMMGGHHRKH